MKKLLVVSFVAILIGCTSTKKANVNVIEEYMVTYVGHVPAKRGYKLTFVRHKLEGKIDTVYMYDLNAWYVPGKRYIMATANSKKRSIENDSAYMVYIKR